MSLVAPLDFSTDIAIFSYGLTALLLSVLPTYLWHTVFKSDVKLNQVGFKVAAYSSSYLWLPVALLTPFYFLVHNLDFFEYYLSAMKFSIVAPWGFGLLSLYYLVQFSTGSVLNTVLFGVYNFSVMAYQFYLIPIEKVACYFYYSFIYSVFFTKCCSFFQSNFNYFIVHFFLLF